MNRRVVLCILDGWGIGINDSFNGINAAKYWPDILKKYPHTELQASDHYVGLPDGQMGNSEVGHMTIGLGRVVMQDLPKIDKAIHNNTLKHNPAIQNAIEQLQKTKKPCHIMGLLSPGGVHAHINHIIYAATLLSNAGITVYVHAFLDGRDTSPQSATNYLNLFLNQLKNHPNIHLSSLCGRYFSMDRDNRWERTELAYKAIAQADAPQFSSPIEYIENNYAQGITDEFILPSIATNYQGMQNGDGLWMINFRSDRVRQLLRSFLIPNFNEFKRNKIINFGPRLAMNEYAQDLNAYIPSMFEKPYTEKSLGEIIALADLKQLRVAETEKYAHVTFFFNGGQETLFKNEERILVPSPKVSTYNLKPQMSAHEVSQIVTNAMERQDLSLIVVNYANADMVGHTGDINAINSAIECLDQCLKVLEQKAITQDWTLIITADHGNAECMREPDGLTAHTAHTRNPVPFVVVNYNKKISLKSGTLADIAPTILNIMDISQPKEMTGQNLLC